MGSSVFRPCLFRPGRLLVILSIVVFSSRTTEARSLRVAASVGDLGAIAREVLGQGGDVVVLARPTQDPHFVDARPSLVLDLNRADALVAMGLDYEIGWLPVLVRGARNPAIQLGGAGYIDASTFVDVREVPSGRIDRSMGDIHPGGNPHYTLDPRNGISIARGLAERLGRLDPAGRDGYARNAESFAARVQARAIEWQSRLSQLRGATIVTYHKSLVYLAAWLGLQEVESIEPKPGIPPNPAHVAQVVDIIRQRHVTLILEERWYPPDIATVIARQTGARLVLLPGMTAIGGSYLDHIDEIVRALAGGQS